MALHEPPFSATSMLGHAPIATEETDLDFGDVDEFEDALEPTMTLKKSLEDCELAIEKFFSNDIQGAVQIMLPWQDKSLYHSHGAAIFEFIPAILTMEPGQVQAAQDVIKETFKLLNQERRCYSFVESIGVMMRKTNFGLYTDAEAHAELIYAEALLVQAGLVVLEGEDFTGLVRATLKIKNSHDAYKDCMKILEKKTNWEDDASRVHFESGVRMGIATFNVMISLLPPKIITLLEFVGFSGDKDYGLRELLAGARSPGLRSVLCSLTLLVHILVVGQFAAIPPDFELARQLIKDNLQKYPNSAWFLMFKGRYELLQGNPGKSVDIYQQAARTKGLWPQLVHLAYWENMWAHAMMGELEKSAHFASRLLEESHWSRTVYAYLAIATTLESGKITDQSEIEKLIDTASNHRRRILGKSVPMEKFALRKCARLTERGYLTLPATEMLCLWNMFPALAKDLTLAGIVLKTIQAKYEVVEAYLKTGQSKDGFKYDADDLALLRHLRGSILLAMKFPRLALDHLNAVIEHKDELQDCGYLVPYTMVEIAMCHHELEDTALALNLLTEARKKSGYPLESRLQFRIHNKIEMLRKFMKANSEPNSDESDDKKKGKKKDKKAEKKNSAGSSKS